jgi:hypothetical protein
MLPVINSGIEPTPSIDWTAAIAADGSTRTFFRIVSGIRSLSGGAEGEVWAGAPAYRVLPDIAGAGGDLTAVSDSADDDLAGTGARTLLITYIEAGTLFERMAMVELDGLTPSATAKQVQWESFNGIDVIRVIDPAVPVTDAVRVNRVYVHEAGTGNENAGDVTTSIGADVQALIPKGSGFKAYNRDASGFFFIPRGSRVIISAVLNSASLENNGIRFRQQFRHCGPDESGALGVRPWLTEMTNFNRGGQNRLDHEYPLPECGEYRTIAHDEGGGSETVSSTLCYAEIYDHKDDPHLHLRPHRF